MRRISELLDFQSQHSTKHDLLHGINTAQLTGSSRLPEQSKHNSLAPCDCLKKASTTHGASRLPEKSKHNR
jgi:hypothetical protein